MSRYMIESPHTKKECLKSLEDIMAKGSDFLGKFDFGCAAGVHKGWAIVNTASESAAKNMLPSSLRDKARVTALNKFTPAQIKSAHQKK